MVERQRGKNTVERKGKVMLMKMKKTGGWLHYSSVSNSVGFDETKVAGLAQYRKTHKTHETAAMNYKVMIATKITPLNGRECFLGRWILCPNERR